MLTTQNGQLPAARDVGALVPKSAAEAQVLSKPPIFTQAAAVAAPGSTALSNPSASVPSVQPSQGKDATGALEKAGTDKITQEKAEADAKAKIAAAAPPKKPEAPVNVTEDPTGEIAWPFGKPAGKV